MQQQLRQGRFPTRRSAPQDRADADAAEPDEEHEDEQRPARTYETTRGGFRGGRSRGRGRGGSARGGEPRGLTLEEVHETVAPKRKVRKLDEFIDRI